MSSQGGMTIPIKRYLPEKLLGPFNTVETKHAPPQLFVSGDVSILESGGRVSIVGSRKPSESGWKQASRLAKSIAEQKVVVVSGLAMGIDTAAHGGAIEAGGHTIAVLGTPLDACYPKTNKALQERIARDHLAISQFPPGTAIHSSNFPRRNRTMALIADATVIVEAGEKSGTRHQGWEALRLGRPLFMMDSMQNLSWANEMVGYGAEFLSLDNLDFLLESLPLRIGDHSKLAL